MATYTITVTGKGGHGSRPDLSINPIDCMVAICTALGRLPGFQVESINAGTSGNVIPAQVAENTVKPSRCTVEL